MFPPAKLIGKKFTRLTVISRVKNNKQGGAMWYCICDCGKDNTVSTSSLNRGDIKSCGCLNDEKRRTSKPGNGDHNKKPEGESNFNSIYKYYKANAKRRKYEFHLTKSEFRSLTKEDCYYCGMEPSNAYTPKKGQNGSYTYSGIDRIDNNIGYTIDNCVPCCKQCNRAKSSLTQEDFLEWAHRLAEHLQVMDEKL